MKKLLAVLLSAVLVFGSLTCGIVLTSAEATPSGLFFDFSSLDAYNDVKNRTAGTNTDDTRLNLGANTSETYSETASAMNVTFSSGSSILGLFTRTHISTKTDVTLKGHTTLAFKIKLNSITSDNSLHFTEVRLQSNVAANDNLNLKVSNIPTLKNTYGWQLVLVDISSAAGSSNLLKASNGAAWSLDDDTRWLYGFQIAYGDALCYDLQWAGIFANEADATAYYNATTQTTEIAPSAPSNMFLDASTEASFTDFINDSAGDNTDRTAISYNATYSSITYDTTNYGMKASLPNATYAYWNFVNRTELNTKKSVKLSENTVLALKVKVNSTTSANSRVFSKCLLMTGDTTGNFDLEITTRPVIADTTDWQLVIMDINSASGTTNLYHRASASNWVLDSVDRYVYGVQLSHKDAIDYTVEWAGIFAEQSDAEAYYAATTEAAGLVDNGKACNQGKDSLAFRFKMTANGVGYADPDAAAANTDFSRAALDGATMVIDGAERTVTDYGVLLSTVAGTEKADLTAYSVTGAKVRKVPAAKLYDAGTGWVQFAVLVKGITAHADNEVFARAYVAYTVGNTVKYAYSDVISTTLNEAIKEVG